MTTQSTVIARAIIDSNTITRRQLPSQGRSTELVANKITIEPTPGPRL